MSDGVQGRKLLRRRGDVWDAVEYAPNGRTFSQVSTPTAAEMQRQGYIIVPDAEFEAAQAQYAAASQERAPHGPYQVPDTRPVTQAPGPAESIALERALRGGTQPMALGWEGLADAYAPAMTPRAKRPAPQVADGHGALINALRTGRR